MTGIKTHGEKTLLLFSGRAHPALAEEVAELELLEQQERQIAEVGLVLIGVRHRRTSR